MLFSLLKTDPSENKIMVYDDNIMIQNHTSAKTADDITIFHNFVIVGNFHNNTVESFDENVTMHQV